VGLNLDPGKLLIILLVAFIVLGPDRLPQIARQVGSAWRTVTNFREQVTEEVRRAIPELDLPKMPQPGAVRRYVNDLYRPVAPGNSTPSATTAEEGTRSTVQVAPPTAGDEGTSLDWGDPGMN
jgi:Sec-independent protein translocase protein TatA